MPGKPRPKPCFLDDCEVHKVVNGIKVWRNSKGSRYYTWDSLHGEIEVFNSQGYHLGAIDAKNGILIKDAVKGRKINIR